VLFYDPVERQVATLQANHTWEKLVFDPWRQETWDRGDTVLVSDPGSDRDVAGFFRRLPEADYLPTWYERRRGGALGVLEQDAARKAAIYAGTPTVAHIDPLGRAFLTVSHNRFKYSGGERSDPPVEEHYRNQVIFDIEANPREIIDAHERLVMRYDYDISSRRIRQEGMDGSQRLTFIDLTGKSLYAWDSRGHRFRTEYDPLRRPTHSFLREDNGPEILFGRSSYGEAQPDPEDHNLRGKVFQVFDQAGLLTNDRYDFKDNLIRTRRQFAQPYRTPLDWSAQVPFEAGRYVSRSRYDALNRTIQQVAPHDDEHGPPVNVVEFLYDRASKLEQVHAWLNSPGEPEGWLDPATADLHPVTRIDYDAKGQRISIDYGNQVRTSYTYDNLTFCLVRLQTRRPGRAFPDDCPRPKKAGWPGCHVQDLRYTYDPAGNITHVRDRAQQAIFFRNRRVSPSADFRYDAIYRLIEATGREHLGQADATRGARPGHDAPGAGLLQPGDGGAMGRYLERYAYDAVGNFTSLQHVGGDPAVPGWTRHYAYLEQSLLEPDRRSNRLTRVTTGASSGTFSVDGRGYDPHGNPLHVPHLQAVQWDFRDQLQMIQRQAGHADADDARHQGERTWYVYDSAGRRARKVTESASGQVKDERMYLGGFEVFRAPRAGGTLVRETLHIMDGKQRIVLVDRRTQGHEPEVPEQLIRYQLSNQLASVLLELDDQARFLTYEEYTPFGATSCQVITHRAALPKRYRFVGKERDDESGFYYFGLRYYLPGLGRWLNFDPGGLKDGPNGYEFVHDNPVNLSDPDGGSWKSLAAGVAVGVGTALLVVAVVATAPITIPASVAIGIAAVGVAATGYTVVQSARQRDVFNNPISKDQADFQMGNALGGALVGGAAGPISGGMGAAGGGMLVPATGPMLGEGATAVAPALIGAGALGGANAVPIVSAMANSGGGGGGGGGGSKPSKPAEPDEPAAPPKAAPKQGSSSPKSSGQGKLPEGFADEAAAQIDKGGLKAEGKMLDDLTSHGNASRVKAATGIKGQSAHVAPRSGMRDLPGYNPRDAITRILNKTTHSGFDNPWKAVFQRVARQIGGKTITAQEFFDTVSKAALSNPHFTPEEARSMIGLLRDELFMQQGLHPTDPVRLPYSSGVKPTK
jgi:RHS repeat-associated protein